VIELDAFLADSVAAGDGKLQAQGAGWNRLVAERLPTVHGRIGLGIVLRVPPELTGSEHALEVRLEGPDGVSMQRIEGSFEVDPGPPTAPVGEELLPIALNVDGVRFERAGVYRFVIAIDGAEVRSVPFSVQAASNATS
jgi:hypothetical protein